MGAGARPAQRRAVAPAHAADFFPPVEVRVDVEDMDRLTQDVHRVNDRNCHAMIAAQHEELRTAAP